MDFDPGKSFFIALIALFGALLVYLAVTGRYQGVGAALQSISILPAGGATIAGALNTGASSSAGGLGFTETTASKSNGVSNGVSGPPGRAP